MEEHLSLVYLPIWLTKLVVKHLKTSLHQRTQKASCACCTTFFPHKSCTYIIRFSFLASLLGGMNLKPKENRNQHHCWEVFASLTLTSRLQYLRLDYCILVSIKEMYLIANKKYFGYNTINMLTKISAFWKAWLWVWSSDRWRTARIKRGSSHTWQRPQCCFLFRCGIPCRWSSSRIQERCKWRRQPFGKSGRT